MKHRAFVLLSGVLTLGLGYWLAEHSRDSREIWLTMGAWILGYWFASGLLARPKKTDDEDEDKGDKGDEEEYEDEEDEEYQ